MVYGKLKFTPFWGKIVIKLSHLLLASSSALNILIYSYKVQTQTISFFTIWVVGKELSHCRKLCFYNPYIFATQCRRP